KRTAMGDPYEIRRTNGATIEQWKYEYNSTNSGSLAGLLADVKLQRSTDSGAHFTTVRQVIYDYYTGGGGQPGNAKDLKTVTIEDGSNNVIDVTAYRYYTSPTLILQAGITYSGGLKYVFNADSYARAMADGYDPTSAADANVVPY